MKFQSRSPRLNSTTQWTTDSRRSWIPSPPSKKKSRKCLIKSKKHTLRNCENFALREERIPVQQSPASERCIRNGTSIGQSNSYRRYTPHPAFYTSHSGMDNDIDNGRIENVEIPDFYGTGSVLGWINQCEQFFNVHNTYEGDKSSTASLHLEGKALKWLESIMRIRFYWPSLKEFCCELSDHFMEASNDRSAVECHSEFYIKTVLECSEVFENEVQESAFVNSEYQDLANENQNVVMFEDVLDIELLISQNQNCSSVKDENDEESVGGVCMMEEIMGTSSSFENLDAEASEMCILDDKEHVIFLEDALIEGQKNIASNNDEVQLPSECNNLVINFIEKDAEIGHLQRLKVKGIWIVIIGKDGLLLDYGVTVLEKDHHESIFLHNVDLLAQFNGEMLMLEIALLVKDDVLWDFKRYKKLQKGPGVLFCLFSEDGSFILCRFHFAIAFEVAVILEPCCLLTVLLLKPRIWVLIS